MKRTFKTILQDLWQRLRNRMRRKRAMVFAGKQLTHVPVEVEQVGGRYEPMQLEAPATYYSGQDVMSGTIRLHVGRWHVRGATKTALLIHGLSANHMCWKVMAEHLQQHGIEVVAVDLRGRGRSDKPRGEYGIQVHVADMCAVIEQLELNHPGRDKPIVIGHSLGAAIGMMLAWKHPEYVGKLVLMDAGAPINPINALKAYFTIRSSVQRLGTIYPNAEAYIERMKAIPMLQPWDDVIEEYIRYDLEDVGDGRVRSSVPPYVIEAEYNSIGSSLSIPTIIKNSIMHPIQQARKIIDSGILQFRYSELRMPVLAIGAGAYNLRPGDEILPPKALQFLQRHIPNCTIHTVEGANHYTLIFGKFPDRDTVLLNFINA
ncbi:MAG: alpha/beta hydrolase [Bacteroidota bacterium]|nr:alpha/beta hydrolase [Candidatus Kapabacteria bacterium]MDW8221031.1 alpha/beta hydrolase [Bacteroidota bacterium]